MSKHLGCGRVIIYKTYNLNILWAGLCLVLLTCLPLSSAKAQECDAAGNPCATTAIAFVLDVGVEYVVQAARNTALQALLDVFGNSVDDFLVDTLTELNQTEQDIIAESEVIWEELQKPALQDMTRQLYVFDMQNAKMRGQFRDAHELQNQLLERGRLDLQAHKKNRPSEESCVAGSIAGALSQTWEVSRAYNNAADRQFLDRAYNHKDTVWRAGPLGEVSQRWKEVETIFCTRDQHAGASPCQAPAGANPLRNLDVDLMSLLDMDTIPIDQPEYEAARLNVLINTIQPFIDDPISKPDSTSVAAMASWQQRRAKNARLTLMASLLNDMFARRIPSRSDNQALLQIQLEELGLNPADVSAKPSYHEIMTYLSHKRFQSEEYYARIGDEGENLARHKAILSAQHLALLWDYNALLERLAAALAVQVAVSVDARQNTTPVQNSSVVPGG